MAGQRTGQQRGASRRGLRGRFRRRPLVAAVLGVGLVGGLLIFALEARPDGSSEVDIGLERAFAGTTYAFDGAVCLDSPSVTAEVLSVEVEQAAGSTTRIGPLPEGARPSIGFPVEDEDLADLTGYRVAPGEQDCTFRLLVTPERQGGVRAGTVRVELGYGPFGLLRRTVEVQPRVTLDVTGTGTDPRSEID